MDQLTKILKNSKTIMNKVETGNFEKGSVNPEVISEGTTGAVATPPERRLKTTQERYPGLEKSGLPQAVKDAMVNNPIDIPEMPSLGGNSFDATPELLAEVNNSYTPNISQPKQTSNTNEQQIRDIVRSEMEAFMAEYVDKALVKEDVQIKVGNTVFSGNLRPLPKKKSK